MIEMNISRGTAAALLSRSVIPNRIGVNIIMMAESKSNGKKLCHRFTLAICQTCTLPFDFSVTTKFSPPFLLIYDYCYGNKQ